MVIRAIECAQTTTGSIAGWGIAPWPVTVSGEAIVETDPESKLAGGNAGHIVQTGHCIEPSTARTSG